MRTIGFDALVNRRVGKRSLRTNAATLKPAPKITAREPAKVRKDMDLSRGLLPAPARQPGELIHAGSRCCATNGADNLWRGNSRQNAGENLSGARRGNQPRSEAGHRNSVDDTTESRRSVERDDSAATWAPFHLEATVRVLQRRPANRVDLWERDRYLRVLAVGGASVLVEVENHGTIDGPDVRFVVRSGDPAAATLAGVRRTVRRLLDSMWTQGPSSGWRWPTRRHVRYPERRLPLMQHPMEPGRRQA